MSEYKCKDCKWLTGKKTIRGIECMNPKLQEKWNGAKNLWMGELRKDNARYKQASGLACKKFEAKEQTMSDDLIKRSDAIETAYQLRRKPNDDEWDWWLRSFNAIPSADRPQGYWTKTDVATYRCSECGKIQIADDVNELNFCCCCGSRNKVRRLKGADDE